MLAVFHQAGKYLYSNLFPISPPHKQPPPQPPPLLLHLLPGPATTQTNWQSCEVKWCRPLRLDRGEVFKMAFPQSIIPNTSTRGHGGGHKWGTQTRVAKWATYGDLEPHQRSTWALIKVSQQQQLQRYTRVFIAAVPRDFSNTGATN